MFKFFRLSALHYALQNFDNADPECRVWPSALIFGIFTIHQLNALLHRPEGKRPDERLLDCCSPHELSDEDFEEEGTVPIGYRHGLFYLSDLMTTDHIWRLPRTRLLDMEDLIYYFKVPDPASIKAQFNIHQALAPKTAPRVHRTSNRRSTTMNVRYLAGPQDPQRPQPREAFTLPADRIRIQERMRPSGPDVDNEGEEFTAHSDDDEPDLGNSTDINTVLQGIWSQLPYDMISMGPNRKKASEPSHILLATADAPNATMDIFRSFDMSRVFRQIQIRRCDAETWDLNFTRYFPSKNTPAPQRGTMQGFPYMKFWQDWRALIARLTDAEVERVRADLRKRWATLKWIPLAASDRAWETKQSKHRASTRLPVNSTGPCPQIAINPRYVRDVKQITLATGETNSAEDVDEESSGDDE
jgi:hypothetical protein